MCRTLPPTESSSAKLKKNVVEKTKPAPSATATPAPSAPTTSPSVDLCINIEGAQSAIPSGMARNASGNCSVPPPEIAPVDSCRNVKGAQTYIPAGMTSDGSGNCVVPPPVASVAAPAAPVPTASPSSTKALAVGNKITSYLQTLNAQISDLNQQMAAAQNTPAPAPNTNVCKGVKSSNGCIGNYSPSYNLGASILGSQISQLGERRNRLNDIYGKVQDYGRNGVMPSSGDIEFLASVGISW
jgi:hypothetical protein